MSIIIQYYSDSLGLSRPGLVELSQRYIYLFEDWLRRNKDPEIFIVNRARGASTIDKLFELFKEDEEYIVGEKDILVIHEGICDCAPRPVSKGVRKMISGLPGFLKIRIISYLHNNRSGLLKRGFVHYLVDKKAYEQILREWLLKAILSFKVIYIFNIADTNDATELHSPGFRKSIQTYNVIIRKVVDELNSSRIRLIDIHSILRGCVYPYDELIVALDGHHITATAHQLYFNELVKYESCRAVV